MLRDYDEEETNKDEENWLHKIGGWIYGVFMTLVAIHLLIYLKAGTAGFQEWKWLWPMVTLSWACLKFFKDQKGFKDESTNALGMLIFAVAFWIAISNAGYRESDLMDVVQKAQQAGQKISDEATTELKKVLPPEVEIATVATTPPAPTKDTWNIAELNELLKSVDTSGVTFSIELPENVVLIAKNGDHTKTVYDGVLIRGATPRTLWLEWKKDSQFAKSDPVTF